MVVKTGISKRRVLGERLGAQPEQGAREVLRVRVERVGVLDLVPLADDADGRLAGLPVEPGAVVVPVADLDGLQVGAAREARLRVPVGDEVLADVDDAREPVGPRLGDDRPDRPLGLADDDAGLPRADARGSRW